MAFSATVEPEPIAVDSNASAEALAPTASDSLPTAAAFDPIAMPLTEADTDALAPSITASGEVFGGA